jgi:hypothetical protein
MIEDSPDEFYMTSSEEGSSRLPEAPHGGIAYSHRNHMAVRRRSGHSDHDDISAADPDTVAGHRVPS